VVLSEGLQSILNNDYSILWSNIYGQFLVENFVWILPIMITTLLIFSNYKIEILSIKNNKIDLILHFLFVGLVAYGIIYYVSPGYINSGYTVRMAPFFIFIFDMGIGLAIYLPTLNALQTYRNFKKIKNANEILNAIYSSLFFIFIIILWFNIQYKYLKLLPPNHFYVLDKLSKEPYKGHSFVSDNYAAPVSVQTEQWAYFDPVIARALFVETKEGNKLIGDKRYLWLADKNTNNEYRKPNYFICMQGQNIETVLFDLKNKNKMLTGCFDIPIIRLARNSQYNGITLVEYDEAGAKRTGFVSWAIVKFEWKKFQLDGLVWESDLKK
jgi:hypothetical protein